MFRRMFLPIVFLLFSINSANAIVPEQGLWWNPDESGRGYGLEIQDNFIFITYYAYGPGGGSAFFTSGGLYDIATNSASVYFANTTNGQCFGCAYAGPPTLTNLGNATISFTSRMTGQIVLPSGLVIPIQRQLFFDAIPRTNLYGTWHLTTGALGVYFGQVLWIQAPDDSLPGGFVGRILDGSSQRILVGAPTDDGKIGILVDSSTNYYQFYLFEWSVNLWGGQSWTYLKTAQLSGSGLPFFGSRLLGKTYSEQASAGGSLSQMLAPVDFEAESESMLSALARVEESAPTAPPMLRADWEAVDAERYARFAATLAGHLGSLQSSASPQ